MHQVELRLQRKQRRKHSNEMEGQAIGGLKTEWLKLEKGTLR